MNDDQRHMPHTITGLSANAVRHKIRRGTLTAYKVNGKWRVTIEEPVRPTPEDVPSDSVIVSAQHQVDVLRDSLVAPLVALTERQQERIAELEHERGRLEESRDIAHQQAKELEAERTRIAEERDALEHRVSELEQRSVESSQPTQTTPQEQPQRVQKVRQRRWWLRLFGINE